MKDGSSPKFIQAIVGTRSSLPLACIFALALTIFVGIVTVPYLSSFPPQQLVSIHQIHKIFAASSWTRLPPPSPLPSPPPPIAEKQDDEQCANLFQGEWIFDPQAALYRNDSCAILSQAQNCQGNGRPDRDYESWRWAPRGCDLPRLSAAAFLELLRGKLLAFVGDSVTRNQMESLMCILMQVEAPVNRGNHRMQRWFFPKHSVTIVRLWSSWLVRSTGSTGPPLLEGIPQDAARVHIDQLDDNIAELLPRVDILVVSTGHWFAKKSAYIQAGELVGWQGWSPPRGKGQQHVKPKVAMDNVAAFAVCVETALRAISTHPAYRGLTILRTYSPDHYEGGSWNSGGSCTGKVQPLPGPDGNKFTEHMRELQLAAFENVTKQLSSRNLSNMQLLDVTLMSSYRADGHPGPFRSPDPRKQTLPGPRGEPPPQDCLHWCLPGPIDAWNHLMFHVIKQQLQQHR